MKKKNTTSRLFRAFGIFSKDATAELTERSADFTISFVSRNLIMHEEGVKVQVETVERANLFGIFLPRSLRN